ncbi:MAG: hypothetical protein GY854_22755 [Deltaproteobacteria bacterium]|nr:hypothetical protein [Deltaproteobacteria bacterium]
MKRSKLFITVTIAISITAAGGASAFRKASSQVEYVPRGAEFVAGGSGIAPISSVTKAPRAFLERYGESRWTQRLGGPTGGFRRIWGEGIPVDPASVQSTEIAQKIAEQFWRDNADLLPSGVLPSDLAPLANVLYRGIRFVSHRQTLGGLPVLSTGNFIAIMAGRIVMIGVRSFPVSQLPAVPYTWKPTIVTRRALEIAPRALAAFGIEAAAKPAPELAIFPLAGSDTVKFELVYKVGLTTEKVGKWTAYVDATKGEIFALKDERLFWDGTIDIRQHERHPASDLIYSPARHIAVSTDIGNTETDENGAFSVTGDPATITAHTRGPYVNVVNHSGPGIKLSVGLDAGMPDGGEILWPGDGEEFDQAQLDAFSFGSTVREHGNDITDGTVKWLNEVAVINVNREVDMTGDGNPDYCNAWFDGEVNFLVAGDMGGGYDCNNTAMVGDIVYHEYGHGIHMYSIIPGVGSYEGAVGEGFADTLASSITLDYQVGPYFTKNGGAVRELETNLVWPDDQTSDPHQTGLIVGGALWDLRKAFIAEYNEDDAHDLIDFLYVGAMRTATDVPSVYESVLLADDDNGNLADGTPHFCTIYDAFEPHGLVSKTLGRITLDHEPIAGDVTPDTTIPVEADVFVGMEDCNALGDVRLAYSVDSGDNWTVVNMTNTSGDAYASEIPAMPEGSIIYYRLEADETISGDVIKRPDNDAEPYYKIYVGSVIEIMCDDFETADPGWTHELISGEQKDGADDWMREPPKGTGGDPTEAHSGDYVWGNDQTPEQMWDGKYQENKINTLRSPEWDLRKYQTVRLRFWRWLNVEDGYFDKASIYVNNKRVWVNKSTNPQDSFPNTHHLDKEWIAFDLDITEQAALKNKVQIRFEIASDDQNQYGGWNIDDFCLYTTEDTVEVPDGGTEPDGGTGPDADADADGDADTDSDSDVDSDTDSDAGADGGDDSGSSGCGCTTTGARAQSSIRNILEAIL